MPRATATTRTWAARATAYKRDRHHQEPIASSRDRGAFRGLRGRGDDDGHAGVSTPARVAHRARHAVLDPRLLVGRHGPPEVDRAGTTRLDGRFPAWVVAEDPTAKMAGGGRVLAANNPLPLLADRVSPRLVSTAARRARLADRRPVATSARRPLARRSLPCSAGSGRAAAAAYRALLRRGAADGGAGRADRAVRGVHQGGSGWSYYARPALGATEFSADDVERVRARQRELDVPESFEWVAETSPRLRAAVEAGGLHVHVHPLLALEGEPSTVAPPTGIDLRLATADDDLRRIGAVAGLAFATPGTSVGIGGHRGARGGGPASRG